MGNVTARAALERLKAGNNRFRVDRSEGSYRDGHRRRELEEGQQPFAAVLSCSDSRVVPELAFDTGLGELFVVRVAGNIADPSTIASLEFAVMQLGVKLIVVMGHENCGAVAAALESGDAGKNLNRLMGFIRPAVDESVQRDVNTAARSHVQRTLAALTGESAILRDAAQADVGLVGSFYHIGSGWVEFDEAEMG